MIFKSAAARRFAQLGAAVMSGILVAGLLWIVFLRTAMDERRVELATSMASIQTPLLQEIWRVSDLSGLIAGLAATNDPIEFENGRLILGAAARQTIVADPAVFMVAFLRAVEPKPAADPGPRPQQVPTERGPVFLMPAITETRTEMPLDSSGAESYLPHALLRSEPIERAIREAVRSKRGSATGPFRIIGDDAVAVPVVSAPFDEATVLAVISPAIVRSGIAAPPEVRGVAVTVMSLGKIFGALDLPTDATFRFGLARDVLSETITAPERVAEPPTSSDGMKFGFELFSAPVERVVQFPVNSTRFALKTFWRGVGPSDVDLQALTLAIGAGAATTILILLIIQSERMQALRLDVANARARREIDQKRRALIGSEARFRQLAASTNVIIWTADPVRNNFIYVAPQIVELSGLGIEEWRRQGFWSDHIHPDDRQRVELELHIALHDEGPASVEYRLNLPGPEEIHVRNIVSRRQPRLDGDEERGNPDNEMLHGFIIDLTDVKQTQESLEAARHRAEEADRSKSMFLANMSHELRTPLNAVLGFSEIMMRELFGPLGDRYRGYAENIHASGRHLLELINDILDLSKIEAGKTDLEESVLALGAVFERCRILTAETAMSRGVRLRIDLAPGIPNLFADERRLKQVLLNLLSNAIKYTEPSGEVRLGARLEESGDMTIYVQDNGVGMAAEAIPAALRRFGQINIPSETTGAGFGLGLPIAKSLIELHGGVLRLTSEPGVGTTAEVQMPAKRLRGVLVVAAEPRGIRGG